MTVRFLDSCLEEVDAAVDWYANQSPELPDRMLDEVKQTVGQLLPFPEAYKIAVPPYRKVNLSRFPYALFFRIDPEEILLVAFFHLHSDPAKWTAVLKSR